MPSPIGHTLAGIAAAWAADLIPGNRSWRTASASASWWKRAGDGLTLLCGVLAASPDLDLLIGAHRTFTHSIGAVVVVGLFATLVAGVVASVAAPASATPTPPHALRIGLMCAAAYATHLLLDLIAVDHSPPRGIQLLWPLSQGWFITPWEIFPGTERRTILSRAAFATNAKAAAFEIATLGSILIVLWLIRVKTLSRLSAKLSRGDHSAK